MKHQVRIIAATAAILLGTTLNGCIQNERKVDTATTTTTTEVAMATQTSTTLEEAARHTTSRIGEDKATITTLETTRATPTQTVQTSGESVTTTQTRVHTTVTVTSRSSQKTATTTTAYTTTSTPFTMWTTVVSRTTTAAKRTTTSTASPTQTTENVADTTVTTTATTTTGTTVEVSQSEFEAEVLRLTNLERAAQGLSPLSMGSTAAQSAADIRAAEIATQFSHTRPNGSSCFTALTEVGVSYRSAGENIAKGHRTPAQVVEGWMNSEGHRANILNANFTHLAVGYADYGWVQLFYTP